MPSKYKVRISSNTNIIYRLHIFNPNLWTLFINFMLNNLIVHFAPKSVQSPIAHRVRFEVGHGEQV